jgi:catechol 2,3-dioxygenase-like lactoylglutathione lyase family enzyme
MEKEAKAIRPFIGARDYELSRSFYQALGFQEVILSHNMCLFKTDRIGFYLQDAYVKDWIDNTMVFVEVDDVDAYFEELAILDLPSKYPGSKLTSPREYDWGKECFLHDPSGILWHFGQFKKPAIV